MTDIKTGIEYSKYLDILFTDYTEVKEAYTVWCGASFGTPRRDYGLATNIRKFLAGYGFSFVVTPRERTITLYLKILGSRIPVEYCPLDGSDALLLEAAFSIISAVYIDSGYEVIVTNKDVVVRPKAKPLTDALKMIVDEPHESSFTGMPTEDQEG